MYLLAGGHVCARRFLQRAASSVVVGLIVCKLLQHVPSSGKGGPLNQASNGDYVSQLPQDLSWSLVYSGQTPFGLNQAQFGQPRLEEDSATHEGATCYVCGGERLEVAQLWHRVHAPFRS